jgi:hypothetical protein
MLTSATANPGITASTPVLRRIPLWLKLSYTAFMAVLVPTYWTCYGPTNFLYFCDVALFLTLVGIWRESAVLISMAAVGILAPQIIWVVDFLAQCFGFQLTGMTAYMFNENLSLFLRGLSLFHGWLPFLLIYLVWRLGYERRALLAWTVLAWTLLIICYTLMPGPRPDAAEISTPVNINYVHGMSDTAAQTWMPAWAWLTTLFVGLPLLIYVPTHFVLRLCFARTAGAKPVA